MKKKNLRFLIIIIIALCILIISAIGFLIFSNNNKFNYETKTSSGQVTIDLTPIEFKDNMLYININVNTHTTKLEGYNLKQLITLYSSDIVVKPEQAPKLQGHHNSGILVFNLKEKPTNFKIIINGIPDVKERVFEW